MTQAETEAWAREGGWVHALHKPPTNWYVVLEWMRPGWAEPIAKKMADWPEMTDIGALYWRPLRGEAASSRPASPPRGQAPRHRIIHAWHAMDMSGTLHVLGSNGAVFRRKRDGTWVEIETYPPGLRPSIGPAV